MTTTRPPPRGYGRLMHKKRPGLPEVNSGHLPRNGQPEPVQADGLPQPGYSTKVSFDGQAVGHRDWLAIFRQTTQWACIRSALHHTMP